MASALFVSLYSSRWGPIEELGIGYVAAYIEQFGHTATILSVSDDLQNGIEELQTALEQIRPVLVGIGCSHRTLGLDSLVHLTSLIRSLVPFAHITTGGYWATFNASTLL